MQHLYAFADESDLYELEEHLVGAFAAFASSWSGEGVELVNRKAPLMDEQDIPDWNIGLFADPSNLSRMQVEELLAFLLELSRDVSLPFVVGISRYPHSPRALCLIDRHIPDGAGGTILEGVNAV